MILIRAHSYVTAADGPVCHLQFHWPLCFCYKHADSYIYSEGGLERGSYGSIKGNDW